MKVKALLDALHTAERLKDATRHCSTSGGRHESVAEHSWRLALMAWLMRDEFPEADMDRVVQMCLVHDLGEAFTGDIPSFQKTQADEQREHAPHDRRDFRERERLARRFLGERRRRRVARQRTRRRGFGLGKGGERGRGRFLLQPEPAVGDGFAFRLGFQLRDPGWLLPVLF